MSGFFNADFFQNFGRIEIVQSSCLLVFWFAYVSLDPNISIVPLTAYQQMTFTLINSIFDPTVGINCNASGVTDHFLHLCKQHNEFITESS